MKLNAKAFGMSAGIIWALGVLIVTIVYAYGGIWGEGVSFLGKFYIGYEATVTGTIIGLIYAFLDASIGAWLMAIIYNKLA